MLKIRIYELAKKLGVPNKIILNELTKLGVEGKTHSSSIEPEVARKIETVLLQKSGRPSREKAAEQGEAVRSPLDKLTDERKESVTVPGEIKEELLTEKKEPETIAPGEKKPEKALTAPEEEAELKIPDRFKKEMETEKIEKFKAKPGMQRAFQTIRKIEPKRLHDQRSFKRGEEAGPSRQTIGDRRSSLLRRGKRH